MILVIVWIKNIKIVVMIVIKKAEDRLTLLHTSLSQ